MKFPRALALGIALCASVAYADTPASSVMATGAALGGHSAPLPAGGEGWFDMGGYCKVVDDVGTNGEPVFIPWTAAQWEDFRTQAGSRAGIQQTTCCRPQANIANLCTEAGATVVEVSRQYGKVGEVDAVTATCTDQWGKTYTDSVNIACQVSGGGPDGPDAQGEWVETNADATSSCTPNAYTSACTVSCGGGTQTTYDSCGNVQAVSACNTQACCTTDFVKTGCSGSTAIYTDEGTCHSGSFSAPGGCTAVPVSGSCSTSCSGFEESPACVADPTDPSCVYQDCTGWYPVTCSGPGSCSTQPGCYIHAGPTCYTCSYSYTVYE